MQKKPDPWDATTGANGIKCAKQDGFPRGRAGMHVAFKAKSDAVYKKHAWDAIPYSTSQRMISMESMALSSPISIIIL